MTLKLSIRRLGLGLGLLASTGAVFAASTPRTLVIIGSSTAVGVGASSYSVSWAGLLTAALTARGVIVRNVSISGTATGDSLARFDHDVMPYRPDFVILATSIINEPAATMVDSYVKGTLALIGKVESIGAVPVVVLPYPWNSFTPAMYASVRGVYTRFMSEGVPIFDFLDGADDGRGHWIAGLDVDGTHPTDAGHRLLFESIPVSLFDALSQTRLAVNPSGAGSWLQNTGRFADGTIQVTPAANLSSWTVSFWIKACNDSDERALLTVNTDLLQLRRAGPDWSVWSRGAALATFSVPAAGFRHIAVTYQSVTKALTVYVDSAAPVRAVFAAVPATLFTFGGALGRPDLNAIGDRFADVLLYRAPLPVGDIWNIDAGSAPWKSLEGWLPMTYSPTRPVLNLAPTTTPVMVNGQWEWSADDNGAPVRERRRAPHIGADLN